MGKQSTDDYNLTTRQAIIILGVSRKTMNTLPLPYLQFKKSGRKYYKSSDVNALKEKSIHLPTSND